MYTTCLGGDGEQRGSEKAGAGAGWPALADLLVFAASFALYAASASPALGWLDSPELVAASVSLGIPHSPGHPLPVFAGAAAALIPLGDLALRVNLAAAAAGAAACAVLCAAGRALAGRAAPDLPAAGRAGIGAAAALVFAGSWAAWSQSVRAEVYALTCALLIAALAAALAWDADRRPRRLVAAGLAGGLALAAHPLIAALLLAPAGVFVLARRGRPGAGLAGATALAGVIGLAAFLYLPVRAAAPRAPELDWGAPSLASRFAWTVSGAMFAGTATAAHASSRAEDAAESAVAVAEAAGAPLVLLAALGLFFAVRGGSPRTPAGDGSARFERGAAGDARALAPDERGTRLGPGTRIERGAAGDARALAASAGQSDRSRGVAACAALLAAVAGAGIAGRALFGFDPETSDHHGYLLPAAAAVVLLAVLGAAGLARAAGAWRGRAAALLAAAGLALAAGRAALEWPAASLAGGHASDEWARLELEPLPPRALLLTSYFQTSDRALALRAVEGTRPDIAVLHRGMLTLPGAREAAERRHPQLAALLRAPLAAGEPTPVAELARVAAARPVLVELDPDLDPAVGPHLVSSGRFARFAAATPTSRERRAAEEAEARVAGALSAAITRSAGPDREDAGRALLWLDFSQLAHHCALGRRAAAEQALRRASALAPGDVTLRDRASLCGLTLPAPGAPPGP